jgi:hypothetical protein
MKPYNQSSPIHSNLPAWARARESSSQKRARNFPPALRQAIKRAKTKVNSEQARHMLGRSLPCPLCAWPGRTRCPKCHGQGFIPTPLRRATMRAIKQAMGIRHRYFILQDVRRFLVLHPNFIKRYSPKPKGLPSCRSLLLSALMELMASHNLIISPVRKQRSIELISQIEDKLKLTPKFQSK